MKNILKIKLLIILVIVCLSACKSEIIDVNNIDKEDNTISKAEENFENNKNLDIISDNDAIADDEKNDVLVTWLGEYELQIDRSYLISKEEMSIHHGLLVVKKDDKYGCISIDKKEIIPIIYDEIGYYFGAFGGFYSYFSEDKTIIKKDDKRACIDKDGKFITEFLYDEIEIFREGLAAVKRDVKWGFIDEDGKEIIPLIYDYSYGFSDDLASVRIDDQWGFIDKQGNQIIPLEYDSALYFKNGLGLVKRDGSYGCIDKENNIIIPFAYESVSIIDDKIVATYDKGIVRFFNLKGIEISPYEYFEYGAHLSAYATPFINDTYIVARIVNEKVRFGVISNTGKEIIPFLYSNFGNLSEDLISVGKDGIYHSDSPNEKFGFIDINGNEIIPFEYTNAGSFSEGLAAVSKNGKWGYINNKNQEVIPFKYDYCMEFKNGLAFAQIGEKWGVINKEGKEITEYLYDNWSNFKDDIAGVTKNDKEGYINKDGNEIVPVIYDSANFYPEHNIVIVEKDGKVGYIELILENKTN